MEEKPKIEEKPKAEAQASAEQKPAEQIDPKRLMEVYKNSPTMFNEIIEEERKKRQKVEEKPKGPQQSAAPAGKTAKYGEAEIKLPDEVNEEMVPAYFDHWRAQGWSPEQVQKEVSFIGDLAGKAKKPVVVQETAEQKRAREDKVNVETLKQKFGADYDKKVEVARRAVLKYGTKETIAKLTASDPVTVEQFYELGKLDVEDRTPEGGLPRGGKEEKQERVSQEEYNKKRYPNSPTMKFT